MSEVARDSETVTIGGSPSSTAVSNRLYPKPSTQMLTVRIRRTMRVAAYESLEFCEEVQVSPDPTFSTRENLRLIRTTLMKEIEAACSELLPAHKENQ